MKYKFLRLAVHTRQNQRYHQLILILNVLRHPVLLPVVYIFFFILLLTLPEKTPPSYFPNYYLPLEMQPEILSSVADELIGLDYPARSGKPLEILQFPLHLSSIQLMQTVRNMHKSYFEKKNIKHFNESMRRIFMIFIQFESISRLRFNRGTGRLFSQKDLEGLADHFINSRWYREALKILSTNNTYGFSEERLLRVLISIQAAAHFFEVPYPALFCLFFQESKFDFMANSATGAKGIGQLTSIALREVRRLRSFSAKELLMQRTAEYLNQVYTDPQIQIWLQNLGFNIDLPKISPIPENIEFTRITSAFMREVGKKLVNDGHAYGENTSLLWYLSRKIRRGRILPLRYAHMHKIFSEMLADQYAISPASTYNIETNILASTMLFSHYYRYQWGKNKKKFDISADARVILAAAAYNYGQTGMRRFLINLKQEFPMLDFKILSAKKLRILFTTRRLSRALQRPFYKIREASRHVRHVMNCAGKSPLLS